MDAVWYILGMLAVLGVVGGRTFWEEAYILLYKHKSKRMMKGPVEYPYQQLPGDLVSEVREKWERPLSALPVHVDIPRLARKISVHHCPSPSSRHPVLVADEEPHHGHHTSSASSHDSHNEHVVIKDLLATLSSQLGELPEKRTEIERQFPDFFKKKVDPSHALAELLERVVGHDSKTARVLKACNQSILAPGVLKLKFAIGNHFPFKDSRGSWRIEVVIGPEWVSVEHTKRERSFDDSPQHSFEFSWRLKLMFDRNVETLTGAELHIEEATFDAAVSNLTRQKIRDILQPWFKIK